MYLLFRSINQLRIISIGAHIDSIGTGTAGCALTWSKEINYLMRLSFKGQNSYFRRQYVVPQGQEEDQGSQAEGQARTLQVTTLFCFDNPPPPFDKFVS